VMHTIKLEMSFMDSIISVEKLDEQLNEMM
jgi:hypothetical protein